MTDPCHTDSREFALLQQNLGASPFAEGYHCAAAATNPGIGGAHMSASALESAAVRSSERPAMAIAIGGVIVGILDLAYAIIVYSPRNPGRIPQAIASGLLGPDAFSGGAAVTVLGLLLHFIIALGAATVFFVASRKLKILVDRAVLCGLMYGAFVYVFMHVVVLPLSATGPSHMRVVYQVFEFIEHWFCVGLPISLSVRHFAP